MLSDAANGNADTPPHTPNPFRRAKMSELKSYRVWDAPTRWFHWINAVCVVALVVIGYIMLHGRDLEIARAGSLKLKTLHTLVGYVFAANLLIRLIWAFLGNRYARWRAILPGGRGYLAAAWSYLRSFFSRHPQQYLGHNPFSRVSITVVFVLLVVLAVSGLVLAGTDLFYPPMGRWIARWVAAPGVDPATVVPGAPDMYNKAAFDSMRAFRKPFMLSHIYSYYALLLIAAAHIAGVIVTEIREGGSIISATFTGRKIICGQPVDADAGGGG
jgi:Ni/Fe-hydrogenase 1 B-type cytochrome subunit